MSVSELLKTQKGQLGTGALALVLVLAAGWFLGVSPQKKKAERLAAESDQAATELAQKRAALEHPAAAIDIRATDGYLLKAALPDAVDMPRAILDIQRLAKRNDLAFTSVTPTPAVTGLGYTGHPIGIVVQGGFGKVARFLGQLRGTVQVKAKRLSVAGPIYSVSNVEIAEPEAPATFPVVRARVTVDAFAFDAAAAAAAATAAAATPTTTTPSSTSNVAAGATP